MRRAVGRRPPRRAGRLALLAALAVAGLAAGCSAPATRPAAASPSAAAPATSPPRAGSATPAPPPTSASPSPAPPAGPPFAVGVRTVTVREPNAATPARGPDPAHRGRVLATTVYYPAAGPPGPADRPGAAPRPGSFPLVAFAHGFNVTPQTYEDLLHQIAADGYVVAAPLFPISGAGLPGPAREDDNWQQPGDLSAVITAMQGVAGPGGWLAGSLDPSKVAAVGQSDGGQTVAAMLLIPADRDPRVQAAVILAGQVPTWGGFAAVPVPVLVEQGSADTINPPSYSEQLYGDLLAPKAYLDVYGYGHLGSVLGASPGAAATRDVVDAFLDATLSRAPAAVRALDRYGNEPGITSLHLDPTGAVAW